MELKQSSIIIKRKTIGVLIVPFMELKQIITYITIRSLRVLIVPFMELKLIKTINLIIVIGLNRTFYGIETHTAAAGTYIVILS